MVTKIISQVTIWLIFSVVWITFWFTFSDSFCGWTRSAKKNWEIKQKPKTSNVFIKIQHLDLLCVSLVPFGHMKFENHLFYFLQLIHLWDGTKIIWRKNDIYTQFMPSSLLPPLPPMPEHQKSLTASAKLLVDLHNFPFIRIVRRLT